MEVLKSVIFAILLTALSCECYRVLQAASYRPRRGYFKVLLSWYYVSIVVLQGVSIALIQYWYWQIPSYVAIVSLWILLKRKSKLKVTKRVARMFAMQLIVSFLLFYYVGEVYFVALLPIVVLLSWLLCLPIDCIINRKYVISAQRKLDESGVKVIAITGSYGKTSVKDCLSTLLCDSITPQGSCNTPLGIAAFINKAHLTGKKYLILEFGARQRGDIKELCALYKPLYGIVTGVCAQHLSTFKTLDNIVATKRELVENIPCDGFCVLNAQDHQVVNYANIGACVKYLSSDNLTILRKEVNYNGSVAEVLHDGVSAFIQVPQVTEYYTSILAICIQTCIRLNQDLSTTMTNIVSLKQSKHRMEMSYNGQFYILDDSYNASIIGVESCANTLAKFDCVKVAISQGIVECGKQRREMNIKCGIFLGQVCNFVIVLGKNSKYLLEGLKQTECNVAQAKSLAEAVAIAREKVNGGILLFQNDLPDVVNV